MHAHTSLIKRSIHNVIEHVIAAPFARRMPAAKSPSSAKAHRTPRVCYRYAEKAITYGKAANDIWPSPPCDEDTVDRRSWQAL